MSNLGLYILDEHGDPVPEPDTLLWARWLETAERHLADDTIGLYRVSTVFMGLDHGFGREGGPVLWETMIFYAKDGLYQERYTSRADALAGHALAVTYAQSLPQPVNPQKVVAS